VHVEDVAARSPAATPTATTTNDSTL
jgi:hypothetical protein